MPWKNSDSRYSTVSIALHWLMLVLLALVYACIELRGLFPKGSGGRTLIVESHFMLGLTVFVLVWLRLFARSLGPAPQIFPASPKWQTVLARLMHWALYIFMITMPILGWLVTSAKGNQVMFYGFDLPRMKSCPLLRDCLEKEDFVLSRSMISPLVSVTQSRLCITILPTKMKFSGRSSFGCVIDTSLP